MADTKTETAKTPDPAKDSEKSTLPPLPEPNKPKAPEVKALQAEPDRGGVWIVNRGAAPVKVVREHWNGEDRVWQQDSHFELRPDDETEVDFSDSRRTAIESY
jgi:hypothetical protein